MSGRERNLAIVIGLLLGYLALDRLVRRVAVAPLDQKRTALAGVRQQLADLQTKAVALHHAETEIEHWRKTSLPADASIASTCYQEYLRSSLEAVGIRTPSIAPGAVGTSGDRRLRFDIDTKADLDQIVRFLRSFYEADILHRIDSLGVKPIIADGRIKGMDWKMTVEAMALVDATTKAGLPVLPEADRARRPARGIPDHGLVVHKNPFQPSRLVDGRKPRESKGEDRADYVIRGTLLHDDSGTLMVVNKKTNSAVFVAQGDYLRVAGFEAKVVEVLAGEVVLLVDGKLGRVRLGDDLGSWKQVENPAQIQ